MLFFFLIEGTSVLSFHHFILPFSANGTPAFLVTVHLVELKPPFPFLAGPVYLSLSVLVIFLSVCRLALFVVFSFVLAATNTVFF